MENPIPRVLVATPNNDLFLKIAESLRADHILIEADSGAEVEWKLASNISLAIVDDTLGDIDPLSLSHLLQQKETPPPPLLLVTDQTEAFIERAIDAGYYDFVTKPIRPIELKARLSRALRRQQHHAAKNLLISHLRHRSERDPLTQLYNRQFLIDYVSVDTAQMHSLIIIDMDHFKKINDDFGHPAGDELLIELGERLSKTLRENDVVVRYGGDEFVAYLPEANEKQAAMVAKRFLQTINQTPFTTSAGEVKATVSIGATSCQESEDDRIALLDLMLEEADHNLRDAKASGRNVAITTTMQKKTQTCGAP